jgi:hypothetical protein
VGQNHPLLTPSRHLQNPFRAHPASFAHVVTFCIRSRIEGSSLGAAAPTAIQIRALSTKNEDADERTIVQTPDHHRITSIEGHRIAVDYKNIPVQ